MNIKQAKQEIINTVQAYLTKDETGEYAIPVERQRPVLLIGPPGIGKTAIMEQVAQECGINLVSYTITHHTRQSAIGLPFISKKTYDGEDVSVTEYTMSEIIASIYDQIEQSGIHEGILFLDEINCVSETLAPTNACACHAAVPAVQDIWKSQGTGWLCHRYGGKSSGIQQVGAGF